MTALRPASVPTIALGMASLVLGTIGLMLSVLPILGIPISLVGVIAGLGGLGWAFLGDRSSLRWTITGTVLCAVALGVSFAISNAANGYVPSYPPPPLWREPPNRPYVPPPESPLDLT